MANANPRNTENADHCPTAQVEIRVVESAYEAGSWWRVDAVVTFRFDGRSVSIREERGATAAGHRLAAMALEATSPQERWVVSTELITSYADVSVVKIALELADGTLAEMERARRFLTDLVASASKPGGQRLLPSASK